MKSTVHSHLASQSEVRTFFNLENKTIKVEAQPLKNPMRLFKLQAEKESIVKARFIFQDPNKEKTSPLNSFDYKVIQINKDMITVYWLDQSNTEINDETVNASKFLTSIKISNIDLPCNDHFYICNVGGFIKEYKKKLKNIKFDVNPFVEQQMGKNANDLCLILTIGIFNSLSSVPYICFENKEDLVFYTELLSHKILHSNEKIYEGTIRMVNEVTKILK